MIIGRNKNMPGEIITRFRVLLAQKAETERRNITLKEVQRETGIAWTTLQSWANNDVSRYDAPVIIKLCDYLNCELGDLIIYQRE
jgi:DNA-binding Xre family transcriptional regulator